MKLYEYLIKAYTGFKPSKFNIYCELTYSIQTTAKLKFLVMHGAVKAIAYYHMKCNIFTTLLIYVCGIILCCICVTGLGTNRMVRAIGYK